MARVVRVLRTLRNHWKKSTVAVCALSYGGHWLKANNLFEKNAAPLLHLAGMQVKVVKTDYEGQAKKLMELLEQTDLLIVAGGDGTLQEVITGLLRRADQASFSTTPIGFIPLGSQNSLSQSLHFQFENKVKHITAATLSILKGETVPLDVLQIKGEQDQPVFALIGLRWGAFRDVASTISKYWYLGPLKTMAAHWFSTIKARLPDCVCFVEPPKEEKPVPWEELQVSTVELSINTHNKNPVANRAEDSLQVCVEPETMSVGEFIAVGKEKARDPTLCTKRGHKLEASACLLTLPKEGAGFYNIDNEEYEAMPVEVTVLPRKLRFFCSAERKEQLLSQVY
ncbi:hypothetical protein JZ751_016119 [Albula glossodonta]|uniref:Acylglycerol kinase, mitochondrial n=1 Tax=Albula glossodonta TaxID=121402 RepID=A0A8T2NZ41_9TELE|nr:hypothetical protein JZ751_016119 [Albula glossodonta]